MCGISGLIDLNMGIPQKARAVKQMCDAMVHRGPDHFGHVEFESAALGMRRLSIIDLSTAGNQPLANEDNSIWCVCNGEIYNYQALRKILIEKGHHLQSHSDVEVIVHLYEEYGKNFLSHLRGMFALALWDDKNKKLILARDRLGIKPVYYADLEHAFVFASELKAIRQSGYIKNDIDQQSLVSYLAFGYVPPPGTMFKEIKALMPGEMITCSDKGVEKSRWWHCPEPGSLECPDADIIPRLRQILEESIALHQISDVPLGAFLSGGIDSTSVVGLMAGISDDPIRTFSIGFSEQVHKSFNELSLAKIVADKFETDHTEIILESDDVAQHISDYIHYLDQPSYDGINTFFVSRAAKQGGLTVALSGLGGDEIFGGYGSYEVIPRYAGVASAWGKLPEITRRWAAGISAKIAGTLSKGRRMNKLGRIGRVDSPIGLYALARLNLWPHEIQEICRFDSTIFQTPLSILSDTTHYRSDAWQMVTELEINAYMGWRLLRDTDVMSMAHSLEVRVPLIDHEVVGFVCGLPDGWQRQYGFPKRMLTTALKDVIPQELMNVPKHGFEFPMAHWMRNELKPLVNDIFSEQSISRRGLFSASRLKKLYHDFEKGLVSYPVIWQFVVLELWLRQVEE